MEETVFAVLVVGGEGTVEAGSSLAYDYKLCLASLCFHCILAS